MPSERELKFTLANERSAETLASVEKLGSDYAVQGAVLVQHFDIYFDTEAYDLLRRGYSLRVREVCNEGGGATLVTLKALSPGSGAYFERTEIEARIDSAGDPPHVAAWPDALRSAVSQWVTNLDSLHPVAALRQERQKRIISLKEGKKGKPSSSNGSSPHADPTPAPPLAELSIDKVEVLRRAGQPARDGAILARFDEVEVEQITEEAAEHLTAIGKLIEKRRGFAPSAMSKFARALELGGGAMLAAEPGPNEAIESGAENGGTEDTSTEDASTEDTSTEDTSTDISPETPMTEACRHIWRQQLMQLLLAEHGVRLGIDAEYVHTMRVAIRRARVAARLFGSYFRKRAIGPHMRTLRKLGKRLGAVRDLDVALQGIARAETPSKESVESVAVRAEWEARREAAFGKLIAFLESDEYRAFVVEFGRFCGTNGAGVKKLYQEPRAREQHSVQSVMPQLLLKEFGRIRAYKRLVQSKKVSAETLHDLRIDCKTMRYSLEFFEGLLGSDGAKVIRKLKDVQDALGAINDAVVEQERLEKWLAKLGKKTESDDKGAERKSVAARRKALAQAEKKLRSEFPARFARLIDADTRRALALAVARV